MSKLFLLRYDTEGREVEEMRGFFEKVVDVHRAAAIPATFFCTGSAIDAREADFRWFHAEVKGDPLFDIQDHSYSHIGLCYESGPTVDELRADYERSFAAHRRVFGVRPCGISICGTSGRNGPALAGFDATEKSGREFQMVADLGVRMINARLTGLDGSRQFTSYAALGHPEIMGFPSGHSDTEWMYRRRFGDPVEYVTSLITERAAKGDHMPLMLHDWCAWKCAADQELAHVRRLADAAREAGYRLATHAACLENEPLWKNSAESTG
jgi:peptidoglycan/xylan/chitin deacetylase (PgdA/CDA1 family)